MSYTANLSTHAAPDWRDYARCLTVDPEIFFPPQGGKHAKPARAICAGCPVRNECRDFALANREKFGIWGGTSEKERRKLLAPHVRPKPKPKRTLSEAERTRLPAAPLYDYLVSLVGSEYPSKRGLSRTVGLRVGLSDRAIYSFLNHPSKGNVTLAWAEKVCRGLGRPELVYRLWPELSQDKKTADWERRREVQRANQRDRNVA